MNARWKVLRAAVLGALVDLVKEEHADARQDATDAFVETHKETGARSIDVTLPDGTVVGQAALVKSKDSIRITDRKAFLAYVLDNHPDQVRVEYPFERGFIAGLLQCADGTIIDRRTGELVTFAAMVPAAGAKPQMRITYAKGDPERLSGRELIALAWRNGELDKIRTGELGGAE